MSSLSPLSAGTPSLIPWTSSSRPSEGTGPAVAANGVRHWPSGSRSEVERGGDLYDFAYAPEGVPQQILIEPRPWWRGGDRASATDSAGQPLEVSLYPGKVTVIDAKSGLETTLDRKSLDLDVVGPRSRSYEVFPYSIAGTTRTAVEEHLAANGDVTIRTNHEVHDMVVTGGPMSPAASATVILSEKYEETFIPLAGPVTSRLVVQGEQGPPVVTPLSSGRVDQDGVLTVILADGREEAHTLPVPIQATPRVPSLPQGLFL